MNLNKLHISKKFEMHIILNNFLNVEKILLHKNKINIKIYNFNL